LNLLEHRAPARWAVQSRRDYTLLLRWVVANYGKIPKKRRAAVIAETCYYQWHRFGHWETVEKSLGIVTSRHIEKGLRWNGRNYTYRGFEFGTIRRYVKKLKRPPQPCCCFPFFSGVIVHDMLQHHPQPCGCFGRVWQRAHEPTVIERRLAISLGGDVVLAAALGVVLISGGRSDSTAITTGDASSGSGQAPIAS
ncbi:MAG: hypothetical protein HKL95_00130, partial [Phycisphaerae bacterium]|nr:hypothetical protein [Phycisphaerae bacterium]